MEKGHSILYMLKHTHKKPPERMHPEIRSTFCKVPCEKCRMQPAYYPNFLGCAERNFYRL
jgi:hypothetical protein